MKKSLFLVLFYKNTYVNYQHRSFKSTILLYHLKPSCGDYPPAFILRPFTLKFPDLVSVPEELVLLRGSELEPKQLFSSY
jgi:hypothetical protein